MGKKNIVLITGGAGFIGTHLATSLKDRYQIRIFDNFRRDALSKSEIKDDVGIEVIKGDVCDVDQLRKAFEGVTHVVHLAAIAGVDTVLKEPVKTMEISMLGTHNVLKTANELMQSGQRIERVIDFSTSEVFGMYAFRVSEGNVTSLGAVGEARWTYAVSKLATEHLAHNYFRQFGLPTCAIRPFNIFGPNQVGEGAVHHFVVNALKGDPLIIHNEGDQIRSWCFIDDIVSGINLCLEKKEALGQTFNIGNPKNTVTIHFLAKEVKRLVSSESKIVHKKWDQQDVELRIPNIDKARSLLGYEPKYDLENGLEKTISWYRARL